MIPLCLLDLWKWRMKHRLTQLVTALALTISVGVAVCWISSTGVQVNAVWTNGTTQNQLISYNGSVYFVQNYKWWRKEGFRIQIDSDPGSAPIAEWPGMHVASQKETIATTSITGKWVSPFIQVTEATEFTSPDLSLNPGSMQYSITAIVIRGVRYWLLMAFPASWLFVRVLLRLRTSQRELPKRGT